jgi:hypothetical protein
MSDSTSTTETKSQLKTSTGNEPPQDSYVKLAMRNMVRKRRQSLTHFFLTTVGLIALLIGLAYLTKP